MLDTISNRNVCSSVVVALFLRQCELLGRHGWTVAVGLDWGTICFEYRRNMIQLEMIRQVVCNRFQSTCSVCVRVCEKQKWDDLNDLSTCARAFMH